MVAHHDSLKLCSDRDLPIWLLRKRHELAGEDVGDQVIEQTTDSLGNRNQHGNGNDLGLEELFSEMTMKDSNRGLKLKRCTMVLKRVPMF